MALIYEEGLDDTINTFAKAFLFFVLARISHGIYGALIRRTKRDYVTRLVA